MSETFRKRRERLEIAKCSKDFKIECIFLKMCLLDKCTQSFRSLLKFKENNNTLEIILVIVPKKVSNTGLCLDIVLTLEKLANHKYNE